MRESEIEKRVTKYAHDNGMLHYKFTSPCHRFVPDHLYITKFGTALFIEYKKLGKTPGPGQTREIARMKDNLAHVYVVDSVEQGKEVIHAFINN